MRKAIRGSVPGRFLLSLYSAYRLLEQPVSQYQTQTFYGTQCLVVSKSVHPSLANFMIGDLPNIGSDMSIKDWCMKTNVPILCAVPNLVQHVGVGSSIGGAFHQSKIFEQ